MKRQFRSRRETARNELWIAVAPADENTESDKGEI
jgi:hypothetical protein